ncbi:hypothetical protein [Nannocystis sp. SCPEA4]|uniref:hypothetical protein n=1 Tax=Nannocystis sp. SCPEA4 TaxID=2996787 RepID=UPI00226F8C05|nr:hypothetical protein [Nannocystis sp. SCPEA4]MCY1060019.1 hypothetical protein [Nannocystis sp. SCPEA4]
MRLSWERWWYSQDSAEARNSVEAGIGVPLGDFTAGGLFDESRFESWKKTVEGRHKGTYFGAKDIKLLTSVASPAILEAYNRCVQTTEPGLQMFDVVSDARSRIVTLYIKYNPEGHDGSRPRVEASAMVNATLAVPAPGLETPEFIRAGSELPFGTRPVTVRITDPNELAVFDLYTDKGCPSHNIRLATDPPRLIELAAHSFTRSRNIEIGGLPYGDDVIHNAPPYHACPNMAEYQLSPQFPAGQKADYRLEIEYAAANSRPVKVEFNGKLVNDNALAAATGGWYPAHQKWGNVGVVEVRSGMNHIRISRNNVFPHVRRLRFTLL